MFLALGVRAASPVPTPCDSVSPDTLRVSLITCAPGPEVYQLFGHTAMRVQRAGVDGFDMVFNYGVFSFSDDFVFKFTQGHTDYVLAVYDFKYFLTDYVMRGSTVYEQELNLTHAERKTVFDMLCVNARAENRVYRYNFLIDNCATRPYHLIKNALEDTIISSYKGYEGTTFRTAITHYTGTHSWVDFGINLVFGRDADAPMTNEQRLFLPEELMNYIAHATLSDGTALVKNQHIGTFPPARVPWYANCWWGIGLFALLLLMISLYDRRRGRLTWGVDVALCVVYLLLIALVIFLTCFSCHPLVGFNWRLILFPLIHVCTRLIYIFR